MQSRATIDHIIIGIRSLDAGIKEFAERTGVTPVKGGRHPGAGTENALVSLGDGIYLEIIAVVPGETPRTWGQLTGMERLTAAGWALRASDIPAVLERLKAAGVPQMGPMAGSRQTPDGKLLAWKAGFVGGPGLEAAPFLIEWSADTVHPARSAPGGCTLTGMTAAEPEPARLNEYFKLVGLDFVAGKAASRSLSFTLQCPKGTISFTG